MALSSAILRSRRLMLALVAAVPAAMISCDLFSSDDGPSLQIAWKVPLPSGEAQWQGRPALVNGIVIAQTGGSLTAFALSTGRQIWKRPLRAGLAIGAENVAYASGHAYAAGADSVYAVDATTGQRLWTFLPDEQAALCESFADDQAVYVGARSRTVYALSADSGHVLWAVNIGPGWVDSGIVRGIGGSGDTLYVEAVQYLNPSTGLRTAHIVALSRLTGQELWRYTVPGNRNSVTSAPNVVGNTLLFGDIYGGSFFAVDRFTKQEVWRVVTAPTFAGVGLAPIERNGTVYAAAQGGVYAATLTTGSSVWKREEASVVGGFDVAFCGKELLLQNLSIRLLNLRDGEQLDGMLQDNDVNFATSAFAASGTRAFVIGNAAAYGFVCER